MKTIRTIELSGSTRQERLPGFAEDFPYIASWAETGQYNGGMVPWHWHPAVELFYMYSGSLVYETPQGTRTFGPGSGGLVNANVLHSTRNLPGNRVVSWIHLFEPSLLGGSVGSRIEQKYLVPITANPALELLALDPADPDQAALLEKLRDSFALDENEFGYELRLRAALGEIWLGLLALPRPEARPGAAAFDEKCKAMLAFVHEHYAEPLRIEQIAAAGFCSQREAFRTFQQCLHVTPLNYLQSYRLQMAADRLVRSGQQITAIAVDCGFASLSYFGKVFRQKFGCTPAQFRSKWQDITNTGR